MAFPFRFGREFLVNTRVANDQDQSTVTALADGRFVVVYEDYSLSPGDTSGSAVRGQIFDPRETAVTLLGSMLNDDYVGTRYGDDLRGFLGNDSILGRSGDDQLFGQAGNDTLRGNHGNDLLDGGFGLDYAAGGAGNDLYTVDLAADMVVEAAGEGNDTVQSSTVSLDLASHANVENVNLLGAPTSMQPAATARMR